MEEQNSIFSSNFTEEVWREEMEHKFRNGIGFYDPIPIRIFKVPKSLKLQKPEAYVPQNIAIGPYHQFDPKLYKMQRCKLHHVRQLYEEVNLPEFQLVFDQIKTKVTDIRGCYYDYLNMHDDTLSWILVLDGLFLLHLILNEARGGGIYLTFDDPLGSTLSIDTIFKDVVMLENQIPFSVLDLLQPEIRTLPSKSESDLLQPEIRTLPSQPESDLLQPEIRTLPSEPELVLRRTEIRTLPSKSELDHLQPEIRTLPSEPELVLLQPEIRTLPWEPELVLLQPEIRTLPWEPESVLRRTDIRTLLSKSEFCPKLSPIVLRENASFFPEFPPPYHLLDLIYILVCNGGFKFEFDDGLFVGQGIKISVATLDTQRQIQILRTLWGLVKSANISVIKIPIVIIDLALKMLETLGISISLAGEDEKPLVPTASELAKVKVEFCKTSDGINSISFKKEDTTLSLPALNLKAKNLEVITMNLLAYESVATPNTPKFARYIELMAAMIRTTEDVKLLKKEKILVGDEDDDDVEIVKLFNGFRNCIKSEGNKEFDRDIEELNEYYDNNWRIKAKKLTMKYLRSSWKIFIVLATILLLLLMALQAFCSISHCHDMFNSRFASLSVASS